MGDGFKADPAALQGAASRITGAVEGVSGSALADLSSSAADLGHDELLQAVTDFCSGVEISAQILRQNSESAGTALQDTARSYTDQDHEVQAAVQQAVKGFLPLDGFES